MLKRSEYCGLITEFLIGKKVSLYGWVYRYRNHGGIVFIDLRDREGFVQIVCAPNNIKFFKIAESIRNEFCIHVTGTVQMRPKNAINSNTKTGKIEILCTSITILNKSPNLPFQIDEKNLSENIRLIYRSLDLRRPEMQRNLRIRYNVTMEVRKYLDSKGFIDIETPILTKSTPEGARDYLVSSRNNAGYFFALPQSPQLFKQVLMSANFDRYYQIAKCFRDEDLRSDRQPEFTQIDCEMSFITEKEIRNIFEGMIRRIFKKIIGVSLTKKFPVLKYNDAQKIFGTDKPDLRIKLKLIELTNIMKFSKFQIFNIIANKKYGRIAALKIPNGINFSRKNIDRYSEIISNYGSRKLFWIKIYDINLSYDKGLYGPILKHLNYKEIKNIIKVTCAENNDIIFFVADNVKIVNNSLNALRLKIGHSDFGKKNNLVEYEWKPLWVVDFPMFEYNTENNSLISTHHPFTSPKDKHINNIKTNPEICLSKSYDMIINGCEIGGGSIRIHKENIQYLIFEILNISKAQAKEKFGFLMDSLKYGAPPHGGIAFGLDRIISIMIGSKSIRDTIAFPKTQSAQCLFTKAPSNVDKTQLNDLHIRVLKKSKKDNIN